MEDGSPTLEVGFAIDTGGSFDELIRLQSLMDSTEARVVAEAAKIEKATSGMVNPAASIAAIKSFGSAATRVEEDIRREKAKTEQSIDGFIKSLDRQTAAVGRSREEQRAARMEEAAGAAARQGNTDAVARLRASQSALYDAQFALMRREKAEAEALAEAELQAAETARVAKEQQTQALRTAAQAYDMFEAAARRGMVAMREQQTADAAIEKAAQAARDRAAAEAAVNAQLLERSRLEAAVSRTMGTDRPRATDAGATYSALAARAAEDEARATAAAAENVARLAREHANLVAMVRGSQAAFEADAAAAERMREATDPLYAATKRLNAEIAESTRLYHQGATAPAEYARQQDVLTQRMAVATQQHEAMAVAGGKNAHALRMVGLQLPDIIQGLLTGQKPFQVLIQQGGQIAQIGMMAEGGLKGLGAQIGGLALRFAPFAIAAGVAVGAFGLFDRAISKGVDTKAIVDGLGLTRAEMKRLKDTSVDTGDVITATFEVLAKNIGINMSSVKSFFGDAMDFMTTVGRKTLAGLYAAFNATGTTITAIIQGLKEGKGITGIATDIGAAFKARFNEADAALGRFGSSVTKQIEANKKADLARQAAEIKKDRTPKTDHHAEQLAREAEAIEAQIRNLYKLADAYGVSGAAALIAEARVKAESQAIKQRGDVEAYVSRQVALAIAQRVADSEKASAATRDQARIQTEVNGMVAAGTVPAERAAELVQERIAELPLLAAIEAAQQRGLKTEADKATAALKDQRDAQNAAKAAAYGAQSNADDAEAATTLATLREELRLVGATDEARVRAVATLKASQEAMVRYGSDTNAFAQTYIANQVQIATQQLAVTQAQNAYNESLTFTADKWDIIAGKVQAAGQGMADAFGQAGQAIGDLASIYANYEASRARALDEHKAALAKAGTSEKAIAMENARYALRSSGAQIQAYGDMVSAAKGFFKQNSAGYKALEVAEKAFRAVQMALAIKSMLEQIGLIGTHVAAKVVGDATMAASDTARAGVEQSNSFATTAVKAVEAVVNAIKSLPFPANIAAGVATAAALATLGVAVTGGFGGSKAAADPGNTGTGTVLGDSSAKSESVKNAIDALKEVDTLTNVYSRQMLASLKSIDSQIGGVAALVVRAGGVNASQGIQTGTPSGFLSSLFGTRTDILQAGLYAAPQSVGSIVNNGFDAKTYSDVQKTSKFLGIVTGRSTTTQFGALDSGIASQFSLILKGFSDAIGAAAGPLGVATDDVKNRLNGFVISLGKIDLQGLTGTQIEEKLSAVFGAAADQMANAAFPGIQAFQKVGEGAFETLTRVASTVEAVTTALNELGGGAQSLGIAAKLGLAAQFDSIGDLTSAVDGYFQAFYTKEEQAAAKAAQLNHVFDSLGFAMPATLAAFRSLVEAQDLTTTAGQATYATLLQLAPAFAELKSSMDGAKSAADVLSEREDLQRKLLELNGDTAAIRALDLAQLDASNRALQQQVWAVEDAQTAAAAAKQLQDAWKSVGDSIMDEVKRIRGLTGTSGDGSFASLMGQFNAATTAARGGDQDAAKSLPGLSQALLKAAADAATSRQELDRVQAQTAASLEATYGVIGTLTAAASSGTSTLSAAATAAQAPAAPATPANDDLIVEIKSLHEEIAAMRSDLNAANATIAGNTGRAARKLEDVTAASGGDAISVAA